MRRKKPEPETVEMEIDGFRCLFIDGAPDEKKLADVRQIIANYYKAVEHGKGYKEIRAALDGRAGLGPPPVDDGEFTRIGRWPGIMVNGKPIAKPEK